MTNILKFDNNINFIVYLEPFENKKLQSFKLLSGIICNIPLAKSGNLSTAFIGCNFTKQSFVFIIWKYEFY